MEELSVRYELIIVNFFFYSRMLLFILAVPKEDAFLFKTERKVPKTGVMLVSNDFCKK